MPGASGRDRRRRAANGELTSSAWQGTTGTSALTARGTAESPERTAAYQTHQRQHASVVFLHGTTPAPVDRLQGNGSRASPHQAEGEMRNPAEVPYGTLDLMILRTLDTMGALHGFGIARRIEQMAQGALALNQGSVYPALLRLEQKGWIRSEWGTSENNRRARFYSMTRAGRTQLAAETELWERTVATMNRLLEERS